ncbi:DNA binding protein DnaJ, heat shock protein [Legionella beliardensis]|uniref:Co-chaperone protein DjlA n=1 Tax=Legionella beliardensis TaxID=91822 RepID=A0A378I2Q9_9GAMM|nr:co-chaperone DjlA [Legionella beliardensis]STX29477.1 DNA binding protein DnaJ, heat shock protein [Legionella beliardensis]
MNFRQFFTTHTWWGKILGCFFGYLIAGPPGALFGILIGNFFDRGLAAHFTRPHWSYYDEKRRSVQKIFFQATFTVMGYVAKADGRVSENEIQMARQLMSEMRLSREQQVLAKRFFNQGKDKHFNLDTMTSTLRSACQDNPQLLKLFMDIQYRSAQVDGLTERKVEVLDSVFIRLGFAPLRQQYRFYEDFHYRRHTRSSSSSQQQNSSYQGNYNHQTSTAPNSLAQAYAILEISSSATKQEVKKAYRRLISQNHPDKLIAQGLPEEMIKMANDKTQKITKAYEQICTSKGW